MVVGGRADFRKPDLAGGDGHGNLTGDAPMLRRVDPVLDAVAGKGELAGIVPVVVLVDDTADGLGVGRIANAIEKGDLVAGAVLSEAKS